MDIKDCCSQPSGKGPAEYTADVKVIPIQKVNEAYERLLKADVKYRFSIDMASLKSESPPPYVEG